MSEDSQERGKRGDYLPIEFGANQIVYFIVSVAVGCPALLWLVGILLGKKMPVELLAFSVAGAVFVALYTKNMSIRLDENGISQGFSIFRVFMRYDNIASVHKETRYFRGVSSSVLVVSQQSGIRRIVIPLRSFDPTELALINATLARKASQAHFDGPL
jgi:hypothetical protein